VGRLAVRQVPISPLGACGAFFRIDCPDTPFSFSSAINVSRDLHKPLHRLHSAVPPRFVAETEIHKIAYQ
jgi:hypothetical protein